MSTGRLSQQIKDAPEVTGQPYCCKGCGCEVGRIVNGELHLGGAVIYQPIKDFRCASCRVRLRWYPPQSAAQAFIIHDFG